MHISALYPWANSIICIGPMVRQRSMPCKTIPVPTSNTKSLYRFVGDVLHGANVDSVCRRFVFIQDAHQVCGLC